jgi:hypothetical protein
MSRGFGGTLKEITNFFLRAKHWQIFVLVFGTYFVGQVAIESSLLTTRPSENSLKDGLFTEALMAPFVVCFVGWLWSMGSFLTLLVDPTLKLDIRFFRFALIYPTLYLLTALPFFLSRNPVVERIILPLHLLAVFCLFYVLNFVSKSLVRAEKGANATFRDYALSQILLWVSPVGVWVIQPRINRFFAEREA